MTFSFRAIRCELFCIHVYMALEQKMPKSEILWRKWWKRNEKKKPEEWKKMEKNEEEDESNPRLMYSSPRLLSKQRSCVRNERATLLKPRKKEKKNWKKKITQIRVNWAEKMSGIETETMSTLIFIAFLLSPTHLHLFFFFISMMQKKRREDRIKAIFQCCEHSIPPTWAYFCWSQTKQSQRVFHE